MAVMTIVQARCRAAPRARSSAPAAADIGAGGSWAVPVARGRARQGTLRVCPCRCHSTVRARAARHNRVEPRLTPSGPFPPVPCLPASAPRLFPAPHASCRPLPTHASARIRRCSVAPAVAEEGQQRSGSAPQHAVRLSREHAVGQPASRPLRPPPKPSSARGAAGAAGGAAEYEAILRAVRGGAGDAAVDRELAQVPPPPPRGSHRVGAVQSVAACRVCRIVRGVRVLLEGSLACFVAVGI